MTFHTHWLLCECTGPDAAHFFQSFIHLASTLFASHFFGLIASGRSASFSKRKPTSVLYSTCYELEVVPLSSLLSRFLFQVSGWLGSCLGFCFLLGLVWASVFCITLRSHVFAFKVLCLCCSSSNALGARSSAFFLVDVVFLSQVSGWLGSCLGFCFFLQLAWSSDSCILLSSCKFLWLLFFVLLPTCESSCRCCSSACCGWVPCAFSITSACSLL